MARFSMPEISRMRAEIYQPQFLWSADTVELMNEAREMCRREDVLLDSLNGSSSIAIYAPRIDERLNLIEERLAALESLVDEEDPS